MKNESRSGAKRAIPCRQVLRILSPSLHRALQLVMSEASLLRLSILFCVSSPRRERSPSSTLYDSERERGVGPSPRVLFIFSFSINNRSHSALSLFLRSKPAHVKVGIEASFLPSPSYVADARNKNYANKKQWCAAGVSQTETRSERQKWWGDKVGREDGSRERGSEEKEIANRTATTNSAIEAPVQPACRDEYLSGGSAPAHDERVYTSLLRRKDHGR